MLKNKFWEKFQKSGAIEDYLAYKKEKRSMLAYEKKHRQNGGNSSKL